MSVDFGVVVPFVRHLGFSLQHFENGAATLHFAPRPEHCNSFGVVHGGALMTFLDVVMASAARSVQPEAGTVTIEMKTSFMRPAPAGAVLVGHGRLLHRTGRLAFVEAGVIAADGRPCAQATGTFRYVTRTAAPVPTD